VLKITLIISLSTKENVVFKTTLLYGAIRESHLSVSVLDACFPLSLVDGAISPEHLTIAVSLIVDVISLVHVARLPGENTKAVFAIASILTIILIAGVHILLLLPLSFAVLEALAELADIHRTGLPLVLTISIRLALLI
jgi:hypothetical protein